MNLLRLLAPLLIAIAFPLHAGPLAPEQVPEPLRPWVPWVLHGLEDRACPFLYNHHDTHRCAWPTRLELVLADDAGSFSQSWQVYHESWVTLPGDSRTWPQDVMVDGQAAVVIENEGRPALELPPGEHRLRGSFNWERLPETLAIPVDTGLMALAVKGQRVDFPVVNADGELWLLEKDAARKEREGISNRLDIQVFRRVIDEVPMQVITRLELDVSGDPREVALGPALPAGAIPSRLDSPLPTRLEPDGRLRIQLRPGHWSIELAARHPKDTSELSLAPATDPWPGSEVWVFDARNHIRLVEITGVPTVDPRQTNLPRDWQQLPAYRLQAGDALTLKLIRRGDPDPEPDRLALRRTLWLDFDGGGYTINDAVSGSMTRGWRLEVNPPLSLGRVAVDGAPQFITTLPGSDKPGVEVRRGAIALTADSRYEGEVGSLSAVGWDHDFHQVEATLYLPPGWRLLAAGGVDNVPDTWLQRWTLLDLFLVLIAALSVDRLWRWPWGLLALLTLAFTWHEADAPRYVWLNLLAAIALLKVLPPGRFRVVVSGFRTLSLIVLLLIAIPFAVDQVRLGIYPQLERPHQVVTEQAPGTPPAPKPGAMAGGEVDHLAEQNAAPAATLEAAAEREALVGDLAERKAEQAELKADSRALRKSAPPRSAAILLEQIDPKANVQTGPGLPHWRWTSVALSWNGPVERGQSLRLMLLSPGVNLLLNFLRVALVTALALLMWGVEFRPGRGWQSRGTALALVGLLGLATVDARAEFPDATLLETLKARLLEPPECLPACAQSPRMRIEISPTSLQARAEFHTDADVAVPLPGHISQWLPSQVTVDGTTAPGLFRTPAGELWLRLGKGRHQVTLAGPLPPRNSVQLPLPLKPQRVEVKADGWLVEGVHENGIPDAQLQLSRISAGAALPALEPVTLPSFARVERTLRLGLDWRVETQIVRLSPPGSAVVLELPALEGESVTTPQVRVNDGKVLVNLPAGQMSMGWASVLEKRPELKLTAPDTIAWAEIWRADVSPIWHALPSGIPVVHHQDPNGRWLPEWRPWPGEAITLSITRPAGIEGQTLTIDNSHLAVSPGQRATDTHLNLALRSSQGGQHTLILPEGARLQSVTIDGTAQAVRQEGRQVTLPLSPGVQNVALDWREAEGVRARFRVPPVDLGMRSVNSSVAITLGQDRWVLLTGGPRLGPAVLFWGVLVVLAAVAVGLGRVRLTPLKSRHWLLLGIGLSQIPVWAGLTVVGWLLALGARVKLDPDTPKARFDLVQVGLALLTLAALSLLFDAVQQGLLGLPEMQIAGNGSSAYHLNWYQDHTPATLPQPWLISVPLIVYRLLMLAWALWLAFAVLGWLRWGWRCFTTHGLWRPLGRFKAKSPQAPGQQEATPPPQGS